MSDLVPFTEITLHIQRYFDDPEAKGKLISDAVDFFSGSAQWACDLAKTGQKLM